MIFTNSSEDQTHNMKSIVSFSNKRNPKEASKEVIDGTRKRLDFEPDLALFYATQKYHGNYQEILDRFGDEFGDIPQIGASIDGMIYEEDIRADGMALILCHDPEAKINVRGASVKGAMKTADKLADKVSCKEGVIMLHFPLVHVPGFRAGLEFNAKGAYYSQRCEGREVKKQKKYAAKFSRYCDKNNIFYPAPTILNKFAEKTNYEIPIVGINVLHTQMRTDSPNIFCNFKDINGGIAAMTLEKEGVNIIYDDIFPNKGDILEDTIKTVKEKFKVMKEFKAVFEKNVLISLDGVATIDAVKDHILISDRNEDGLMVKLEKGNFEVQIPYVLLFFNEKTNGMTATAAGSYYPFDLFPFFVDISEFSERVLLIHEPFYGQVSDFISTLYHIENPEAFSIFCVDQGSISAFGTKIYELAQEIKNIKKDNYFGIITESPSVFLPTRYKKRDYILETEENTFFSGAGTNICMEL